MPELLAPAGSHESLAAAIQAGADAVYFGVRGLNMRAGGKADFTEEELPEIVSKAHQHKVKAYLALNTIVYDREEERIKSILKKARQAEVDAVIAWDPLVIEQAREQGIPIHVSTQASIANYQALKHYAAQGAKAAVLARELDLEQIRNIIHKKHQDNLKTKIELFVHGAMCVSVSGRCFMSLIAYGKSANRGECIQPCRRSYTIKDPEEGTEYQLENSHVMSPKDLCAMPVLDKVLQAKPDILKIEGRMRSPEYVKTVTESYKEAIRAWEQGRLTEELKRQLVKKMETVYNKGFSTGFYNGQPLHEWAGVYGSKATKKKTYAGRITNYYEKQQVAEARLESTAIKKGQAYLITGPTTGVQEGTLPELRIDDEPAEQAGKGAVITFKAPKARVNDKLYLVEDA
ncbi:MAG: peptidase U32 family protein [Candidatus Woesearchaeota archaeon]